MFMCVRVPVASIVYVFDSQLALNIQVVLLTPEGFNKLALNIRVVLRVAKHIVLTLEGLL